MLQKKFNDTGLCIPQRHYMVDISDKLHKIEQLVAEGDYFTINRPRQFGKTTTLFLLTKQLNQQPNYLALNISFEELDSETYQHHDRFIYEFLTLLATQLSYLNQSHLSQWIEQESQQITSIPALSRFITKLIQTLPDKSWVLLIDEVDKSSNNQLFLDFLAMLRNKYLQHRQGQGATFQSVILAGVHDVKTLKAKIRPTPLSSPLIQGGQRGVGPDSGGELKGGYNSPWNIAIDFKVDLSFSVTEINSMLQDYAHDNGLSLAITPIAERLYYYSSGYPYLVSKLCKFMAEELRAKNWSVDTVDEVFRMITDDGYSTTLFDSLVKNLENNPELYNFIFQLIINGQSFKFTITDSVVNLGYLYGILVSTQDGKCQIHNRIFEQRIYLHMFSKLLRNQNNGQSYPITDSNYYTADGLNLPLILRRFQAFMKEQYAHRDAAFLEREGRLLFLSFLKPIINGKGFDFKEPNVGDERRMDIVITYRNKRYVLELKIWYGAKAHEEGLQQLSDYLDLYGLSEGYLLIYDFNKNKEYKEEPRNFKDKQILAVWV